MKLLLRIAYNGSGYCGFQKQANGVSIQEVLTEALSRTVGMPCSVTGCSRTDAGVHAHGFCAAVEPRDRERAGENWLSIPPGKIHRAAKRVLPEDIAITGACMVADDFHPRYSVTGKTYLYRLSDRPWHDPFCTDRVWETFVPLTDGQIAHMQESGQILVGKHNFASFMAAGSKITDPTRTVTGLTVERLDAGTVGIRISADGFLYNMVRIITGTLWEFGTRGTPAEKMREILEGQNRTLAGKTAPACGLYLDSVEYPAAWGVRWLCE
ncbi:MAG: tRNA pseudouridine(38-40) synthase TruA [Clostridia bacterium]|nr:tRNA pseudouridine(38-40) synthase TruA [Clostridia bacterium]